MGARLIKALVIWLVGIAVAGVAVASGPPHRVVSLGGSVTEIIYELGRDEAIVANDLSSVYPAQATKLPRVGYYRNLPLEGLVSLKPDLILASEQAGPATVLDRVRALGIPVEIISDQPDLESLYTRVEQIATRLGVPEQGHVLEADIRQRIDSAVRLARHPDSTTAPVSAVVLMRHSHQLHGAGGDTSAAALLRMAGLINLLDKQRGYKPMSAEALAKLQPELIITTSGSAEALGGAEAFGKSPGVKLTTAAQRNNILVMDELLILGLGPRTDQAIQMLARAAADAKYRR